MAETAEALLDEDERLHIPRPSQEAVALPASTRVAVATPKAPALEWHRMLFYVVGAAASLFFLLILAQQINPPDSALRDQAVARVLAPWDGRWSGTATRMDLQGNKIETLELTREYTSSNASKQMATFRSQIPNSKSDPSVEFWVNQVRGDNRLVTRRADPEVTSSPYEGTIEGGLLVWTRTTPEGVEVMKSRISGTSLFLDETFIPTQHPETGWTLSGTLNRTAAEEK